MALIPRLRGAGGRWLRKDADESEVVSVEMYDTLGGRRQEIIDPGVYFHPEEPEPEPTIFWQSTTTDRLVVWSDFQEGVPHEFDPFSPPEGVTKFRVFAYMQTDSVDDRGLGGSSWIDINEWPPDPSWIGAHGAPRIDFVTFQRGRGDAES